MITFQETEEAKFASLCLALAASEQCEDWTSAQIEKEAHRIMDLHDERRS